MRVFWETPVKGMLHDAKKWALKAEENYKDSPTDLYNIREFLKNFDEIEP
jgi:hypothetical protein